MLASLAQSLLDGLLIGLVYALIGIGLTIVFSAMSVINFAHGDFIVVGMYTSIVVSAVFGLDPYLGLVAAVPLGFVIGFLLQKFVLQRVVDEPPESNMLVTLGISLIVANTLLLMFGSEPKSVFTGYGSRALSVGPINISVVLLLASVVTGCTIVVLHLLLNRTTMGLSIRAISQNRLGAELVGINSARMQQVVMGVGTALAAIAGVVLIPLLYATPTVTGPLYTLKAFVIVVLGGLGSVAAAMAGGLVLGLVEVLGSTYLSSDYREAYGLVVFVLVLLWRPNGLFGRSVKRV